MRLNLLGRLAVNTPFRAAVQRRCVGPALLDLGAGASGCRVLDLGCGRGIDIEIALESLGAAHVDAVDLDSRMLRRARRRCSDSRVDFLQADATHLPMRGETYDIVLDFGTLYLAEDWPRAIDETLRVLKPGGRFVFEVPSCALTRLRDPFVTEGSHRSRVPFGRQVVRELEQRGCTVASRRLRLAGTIQLAGDLIGVATKSTSREPQEVGSVLGDGANRSSP